MAKSRTTRKAPSLTTVQALAVASQFGVSLAVTVGLGLFVGQWLDGQLHTGLVFTLIGVFLGLATAVTASVTLYRAALRKSEREQPAPTEEAAQDATEDQTDR